MTGLEGVPFWGDRKLFLNDSLVEIDCTISYRKPITFVKRKTMQIPRLYRINSSLVRLRASRSV